MYYEFFCPVKVISGENAIFNLPNELDRLKANRPLIITDRGIEESKLLEKFVKAAFMEASKPYPVVFGDIPVESSTEAVDKALKFFRENRCDSIVAVGGGSVLDSAKAVNMLIAEGEEKLLKLTGVNIMKNRGVPFVAVPTTSGTGSEVTSVAVIFDEASGSKLAFASPYLMPDVAIIDPQMSMTMPGKLTAASGIDALSHAIESFISIQSNPISRAIAFEAVKTIYHNLEKAIKNPGNLQIRLSLANASLMAGMAFSNAMVGIIHSMAHAAGSVLHIPHGVAVSLFLIPGLKENIETSYHEFSHLLNAIAGYERYGGTETERAWGFIYLMENFVNRIRKISGIPSSLTETGYNASEHQEAIISLAMGDGSSIFNRVELNPERAKRMLEAASA